MAVSTIGEIGIRFISLPSTLVHTMTSEVPPETLRTINGGRLPNSVTNLQPKSPYIQVLNKLPMQTTYHSIVGNRGKPGPLADSSDGVVPYWSSHEARSGNLSSSFRVLTDRASCRKRLLSLTEFCVYISNPAVAEATAQ